MKVSGCRKGGWIKYRWKDKLKEDIKVKNLNERQVGDRIEWKSLAQNSDPNMKMGKAEEGGGKEKKGEGDDKKEKGEKKEQEEDKKRNKKKNKKKNKKTKKK